MFHVPRTVGFACHMGCVVLFSPWRIAFRVDAIYACLSGEARRSMFCSTVVGASGHSPSHMEVVGSGSASSSNTSRLWRFWTAAGYLYSAQQRLHICSCDRPISYRSQTQNLQKPAMRWVEACMDSRHRRDSARLPRYLPACHCCSQGLGEYVIKRSLQITAAPHD